MGELQAVSPAFEADAAAQRAAETDTEPVFGTLTLGEGKDAAEYAIKYEPSFLLLSEMARIDSGSMGAMSALAELFEMTLGEDAYPAFRRHVYRLRLKEDQLMDLMTRVIEATTGRPTS